jgi:hypothetical protein
VAVAAAFVGYVRLAEQGKNPVRDFASGLVTYAVLHAKSGRQIGSPSSTTDALSPLARRRRGFRVESLSAVSVDPRAVGSGASHSGMADLFDERLTENARTPVPDQAAFRIDFPAFLSSIGPRDRALAQFLSMGHSAQTAAVRFGLSEGRVSQLRRAWREQWQQSQGDIVAQPAPPISGPKEAP